MIIELYKKYISKAIRYKIRKKLEWKESIKCQLIYTFRKILPDTTSNKLYAFMGKYGLMDFPYQFVLEYNKVAIDCLYDDEQEMYYIIHQGKKLYFPSQYSKEIIISLYKSLIIEQDIRSPHRYVEDLNRLAGKTILDVGAAEGIFSLNAIEKANHVYLFEYDKDWIKPLNATFAPWSGKVTIIPKYVNNINNDTNITIDYFLEGKNKSNLFLKMDIEGYERAALQGAANTLKEVKDLDYSICTYHCKDDVKVINKLFSDNHFESEFTAGFFYIGREFRKAIIRRGNN